MSEYAICSNTIRVHGTTAKGYFLRQFTDAFARYVFAEQSTDSSAVTPEPYKTSEQPPVTRDFPVTPQSATRIVEETPKAPGGEVGDGVMSMSSADGQVVGVPSVTLQNLKGNTGVTCNSSAHEGCNAVTPDQPRDVSRNRTPNQNIARSAVTALLVKERMNSIVNSQEWSKGLPVDSVADSIKDKLVGVDSRLRRSIAGHVIKQLAKEGDLIIHDGMLDLPSNQNGNM